jgi:hypothetical protein
MDRLMGRDRHTVGQAEGGRTLATVEVVEWQVSRMAYRK